MASDTYVVTRSTTVQASPEDVHEHIHDFHKWDAWSPWADIDPEMQVTHAGPEKGVGAVYTWSGNRKAGAGRMELTHDRPGEGVKVDLRFDKPFKSESVMQMDLDQSDYGTTVTWTLTGEKTFAIKVMGIFTSMDKMVGPDFERGLTQLKAAVEAD